MDEGGTGGPGAGMQERARRWRRAEARDILAKSFAGAGGAERGVIATAHHRDDQAETVLLKALRGAHITKIQARRYRYIGTVLFLRLVCILASHFGTLVCVGALV